MGLPPWATSPNQLFVLVTGANSGIGYCACERLITEFLTTPSRDETSHLVLTVTTRSRKKTKDTIDRLRKHVRLLAERQRTKAGGADTSNGADWKETMTRIHLLGTEVELCDIRGVYEAAARIRGAGLGDGNTLQGISIPRLDVLIMNAGISGFAGFDYLTATVDILTNLKQTVTWSHFVKAEIGVHAKPQKLLRASNGHTIPSGEDTQQLLNSQGKEAEQPILGEVFLSNVFGHYLLAHQLIPLLQSSTDRPTGDKGRIIWMGSLDATKEHFNIDDIQGLAVPFAYKSSKRLTDYLSLTSHLPGVQRASASFFECQNPVFADDAASTPRKSKRIAANGNENANGRVAAARETLQRPEMYNAHPGICVTDIVPVALWQRLFWTMALYLARWLGSVWHPVTPYKGACAAVWMALAKQKVLDELEGPEGMRKGKWGTRTDFWGQERVARTEVDGWGWDGTVGSEIKGEERKGRKHGAVAVTKEEREQFEVDGSRLWREMEEMRHDWENRLGLGAASHQ